MIPSALLQKLPGLLSGACNRQIMVTSVKSIGGGCINSASRIDTDVKPFFIKWNNAGSFPGMFETEAKGLLLLASTEVIKVPQVVHFGEVEGNSYLILEFISETSKRPDFWDVFGTQLAELHRNTDSSFGLAYNNYIGSLTQHNSFHKSWPEFFMTQRLEVQARLAFNSKLLGRGELQAIENLGHRLGSIFPTEKPSLLHGDLWNGNYMTGPSGEACIIDPAVYYGHREMDLGMSKLFGGFADRFYEAYHHTWPLEPGWQQRVDICNLYPLLVHVNLFGSGYVGQVREVLSGFYV